MQEASGRSHQGPLFNLRVSLYLPLEHTNLPAYAGGLSSPSNQSHRRCFLLSGVACPLQFTRSGLGVRRWNQTGPRLSLLALLLLQFPLLLKFTKFVELPPKVDIDQQLLRPTIVVSREPPVFLFQNFRAFFPRNKQFVFPIYQFSAFFQLGWQQVIRINLPVILNIKQELKLIIYTVEIVYCGLL